MLEHNKLELLKGIFAFRLMCCVNIVISFLNSFVTWTGIIGDLLEKIIFNFDGSIMDNSTVYIQPNELSPLQKILGYNDINRLQLLISQGSDIIILMVFGVVILILAVLLICGYIIIRKYNITKDFIFTLIILGLMIFEIGMFTLFLKMKIWFLVYWLVTLIEIIYLVVCKLRRK